MRAQLATYYAMVENLDWNIGRLRDELDSLPVFRSNRLTAYFSDHGDYMGTHGAINRKENPHENAVRIPAIFHWPEQIPAQGRRDGLLFSLVDLFPTTLGLLGLDVPVHVRGSTSATRCGVSRSSTGRMQSCSKCRAIHAGIWIFLIGAGW